MFEERIAHFHETRELFDAKIKELEIADFFQVFGSVDRAVIAQSRENHEF